MLGAGHINVKTFYRDEDTDHPPLLEGEVDIKKAAVPKMVRNMATDENKGRAALSGGWRSERGHDVEPSQARLGGEDREGCSKSRVNHM